MSQLLSRALRLPSWFPDLISVTPDNALDANSPRSSLYLDHTTLNPLEIDLVLRKIFSYLPVESLLRSRLVSRSWNDAALRCLRQEPTKGIYIFPWAFARLCIEFKKCSVLPFTGFICWLNRMKERDFKCCVNFLTQHSPDIHHMIIIDQFSFGLFERMRCCILEQLPFGWVQRIVDFFIEQTPFGWIDTIMDYNYSDSSRESMASMNLSKVQRILGQTPNLKRLSLYLHNSSPILNPSSEVNTEDDLPFRFPQLEILTIDLLGKNASSREFLERVFAMAPNLRVLVIWEWLQQQEGDVIQAMEKLQLRAVLFIHHRAAAEDQGVPIYRAVAGTQKLKSLGICLKSGANQTLEEVDVQHDLLESQAEHLDTLFLLNGWYTPEDNNDDVHKLRLPILKKVTHVSLSFFQFTKKHELDPKKVPFNMHPLTPEQVPSLRTLNLYTPYLGLGVIADSPFWTVTQLLLQNQEQECYPEVLSEVASKFPNLKKLHNLRILNMSSADVALIVSSWPNMEDLSLTLMSDRPQTEFNLVLSRIVAEGDWMRCVEKRDGSLNPGPSLVQLKNLKKCALNFIAGESDNWLKKLVGTDKWFHLDETAVYQTFLRLSPELRLHLTGDFSISDDLHAVLLAHYRGRISLPSSVPGSTSWTASIS